jgi:outer membrane protein OmpA-like peptidoglycan-associated protein/tetratricopeptide (TPR) repeat protein
MKFRSTWVLLIIILLATKSFGQSVLQQAERQYDLLAYNAAIELFEQALKSKGGVKDKKTALTKLAYSYRQVRDYQNSERVYRDLIGSSSDLSGADTKAYLYYAQALAANGKYKESQEAYDKYIKAGGDVPRGNGFSKLYQDVTPLTRSQGSYKIDYLSINTAKADFSPMYYQNGLVFCSARNEDNTNTRKMFNWDGTKFLDLYLVPDLSSLSNKDAAGVAGSGKGSKSSGNVGLVGDDEYTFPTANDSKTIGSFTGAKALSRDSYQEDPTTASENFSKSLNTKYHEGPTAFTKDYGTVIFTRNNYFNGKYRESSDKVNKLKLFTATSAGSSSSSNSKDSKDAKAKKSSKVDASGWSNVKEAPFNSDEYSVGHPAITKDDKLVYFSSDMPGGFGGTDIYVVEFNGGNWGTPVNLGPSVNTAGNEMFPYVDEKGHLYFSSDGLPGLGELDMFFIEMANGTPTGKPRNLGAPLNSTKDDFGLITDGERKVGYFSSNRKRGGQDDDIYRFTREGSLYPCKDVLVAVYDADTKMPLDNSTVDVELKGGNGKGDSKVTDSNGTVKVCLDDNQEYSLKASREGYSPNTVVYTMTENGEEKIEIPLSKPKETEATPGESTVMNNSALPMTKAPAQPCKVSTLKGRLTSNKDKSPLEGVVVTLKNECDGTTQQVVTGPDGRYEFDVCADCDYTLDASKDNMGVSNRRISKVSRDGAPEVVSQDLSMFEEGDIVQLNNIYYDFGKCNIRSDAARELDKLAELMIKYSSMRIELRSHTDSRSSSEHNQKLSAGRAREAVQYLEKKGISKDRMIAAGYGESQLVNECADGVSCSEEQHQQNRRTEFKVLQLR